MTFLSEEMGTARHSLTVRWRPPAVAPGAKPTHSVLRYRVCSGDQTGARAAPEAEPEPESEPELEPAPVLQPIVPTVKISPRGK